MWVLDSVMYELMEARLTEIIAFACICMKLLGGNEQI